MVFNLNAPAVFILAFVVVLNVAPCTCRKSPCFSGTLVTNGIRFRIKDSFGRDIISANTGINPAPDSIKLNDAASGFNYSLLQTYQNGGTVVFSQLYHRAANAVDSLIFRFGSSRPDTLLIYTGMVETWGGVNCPNVQTPGITKVILRSQVILQATSDTALFTLIK